MISPMSVLQPNIGSSSLLPGDQPQIQVPQGLPQPKIKRGMFGGGVSIDPGAFLAAFAAGMGNPAGMEALQAIHQRRLDAQRQAYEEAQYQRHRQDELTDYGQKLQIEAQYKAPDYGEFERELIATGVQPGSPEWAKAMQTRVGNTLDPIVITPQGPMLRSMVMGAMPQNRPAIGSVIDDPRQGGPALTPPATFPRSY